MQANALTGLGAETATGLPSAPAALDKDAFMNLLVHQLKNQDPLEPIANEDFIAQLAGFSSLEQMETLNENIVGMVLLQQSNALLQQLTDSSSMIGKTVAYVDPASGAELTGTVTSVKVSDGLAVLGIGGGEVPLANVNEILGDAPPSPADSGDESAGDENS